LTYENDFLNLKYTIIMETLCYISKKPKPQNLTAFHFIVPKRILEL